MTTALLENSGIADTGAVLTQFVCDERQRAILEAREKTRRDLVDIELGGFLRGQKQGFDKGVFEGIVKSILRLIEYRFNTSISEEIRNQMFTIQSEEQIDVLLYQMIALQLGKTCFGRY